MRYLIRAFCVSAALALAVVSPSRAQQRHTQTTDIPRTLSYQGVLANASGQPLADGEYMITACLYSDAAGTVKVWQSTYTTTVHHGIFNISLGGGDTPLPTSSIMGGALWAGIQLGEEAEMRPLTPLSTSAYALNVANNAITKEKMATDYVGSLSINGEKLSGRGNDVNFVTGDGVSAAVDPGTSNVILSVDPAVARLKRGVIAANTVVNGTLGVTGATSLAGSLTVSTLGAGVVHSSAGGLLSSSALTQSEVSGIVPLTKGATGVDNSTGIAAHAVFAGPVASSGAASFRGIDATDLPNTAVTAASYVNPTITIDAQGRITAASNGGAAGPTGATGAVGPTGVTGAVGPTGVTGAVGPTGVTGAVGPTGTAGSLNAWGLTGTAGTTFGTNFIGTTDGHALQIRVNNQQSGIIEYAGNQNTAFGSGDLSSNSTGNNNAAVGHHSLLQNTTGELNSALGSIALGLNTTGKENSATGFEALQFNTTGNSNTADGTVALRLSTTGDNNTAIGAGALYTNITGSNNTALGDQADVTTGALSNATAIGAGAKVAASNLMQLGNTSVTNVNTSGTYTAGAVTYPNAHGTSGYVLSTTGSGTLAWVSPQSGPTGAVGPTGPVGPTGAVGPTGVTGAVGPTGAAGSLNAWGLTGTAGTTFGTNFLGTTDNQSLQFRVNNQQSGLITSDGNTGFGYQVSTGAAGSKNSAFGTFALQNTTTGHDNAGFAYGALQNNTTGYQNTATGAAALIANTTGYLNTANGQAALAANTTGFLNTATGVQALTSNVDGARNTAVGAQALTSNTSGAYSVAVGWLALNANTTGGTNVAVGVQALTSNTTGTNNTAIGPVASYNNSTASENTSVGYQALATTTTGGTNTALGSRSQLNNTIGYGNTSVGWVSMNANTTGLNNVGVGTFALYTNQTGSNNTMVGYNADVNAAAVSGATAIGSGTSVAASNATAIGIGATVTVTNTMQLGNTSLTNVKTSGTYTAGAVTYPNTDGSTGQLLKTNGSGTLGWVSKWVSVPASATASGTTGEEAYDSSYIYVCIATNTWVRSALTTW